MKKPILSIVFILLLINPVIGNTLRIGLNAELAGEESTSTIFRAEMPIHENEIREIFTGPYTLDISFEESSLKRYDFNVDLYGLAPEYRMYNYEFNLAPGEKMLIPTAPVKTDYEVNYVIVLLDDTSSVSSDQFPLEDTTLWSISETTHYRTHWVLGSLIDFKWNGVMRYLELIYNKYRQSYNLSEFEKIDLYFHPLPTDQVYMNSVNHYSIKPRSRRIDLVYGHDINAATPAPACELLTYRLWGYGPRWMVTGLARYHEDNLLRLREFINDYNKKEIRDLLEDELEVRGYVGSILTGALVFWLLQNESFAEFKNLYLQSTALDFEDKFWRIYKYPFRDMLDRFLDYAGDYTPTVSELDYFSSLYFGHGNMAKAGDYYKELSMREGADRNTSLMKLATCYFWLGDYVSADSVYNLLLEAGDDSPELLFMKGEVKLAEGNVDSAMSLYSESYEKGFTSGRLRNVSILMERGDIDAAELLLNNIDPDAERLLDYMIEMSRLKIVRDNDADSLLGRAIQTAINSSRRNPDDPRPYLILGKAYSLKGDYEKSIYQLNTSYFLEESPFNQAFILLEMGRTEDLLGDRQKAERLYKRVIALGGGKYQSMLAENYLNTRYQRK